MRRYGVLPFVLLAAAIGFVLFITWQIQHLLPPERVRIAAGGVGSGYHDLALDYRRLLARDGIDLEIVETAGSRENIAALLEANPVDLALVQGGLSFPPQAEVEALAALTLEPILLIHGGALEAVTYPPDWQGLRIARGGEGSGTLAVFEALARLSGMDLAANTFLPIGGRSASEALLAGEIDAAIFVAPLSAPYLDPLMASDAFRLAEILHTPSLARRLPDMELVTVPQGGIDYRRARPGRDVQLLALNLRLVARADLHPAVVDRVVQAARQIHGARTLISDEGQFPSSAGVDMPIDSLARRLLDEGPSPFADVLPFWMAAQLNAIIVLLLPILLLILPVLRGIPSLFSWRMRSRVFRHYRALARIEEAASDATDAEELKALALRLDALDRTLLAVVVPAGFRDRAYAARLHTDLVRQKVVARRAALAAEADPTQRPISDRGSG